MSALVDASPHWLASAACRDDAVMSWTGAQAEDFFIVGDDWSQPVHQPGIERARATCAQCPVREECLAMAYQTRDRHAVLGGLTPVERSRSTHNRPARVPVESGNKGN